MRLTAFADDTLAGLDALAAAEAVRAGTVDPRELVAAAAARAESVSDLGAVAHADYDAAVDAPTRGGLFGGVPTFAKDNIDVAGMPTGYGCAAFTPKPVRRSSPPARQFLGQGFAVLGKSQMPELGLTASTEFARGRAPARNPWDTSRSVGGSSGGAAALVASGVVPIAHGNDGGGSIRIPAACAGLVGLKPSRGRMADQPGVRQLPVNLVTEGVLTRTVRDTAHYLAAVEAAAPAAGMPPIGLVRGPSNRRLRIGLVTRDVRGREVHQEVRDVVLSAAKVFADAGHTVEPHQLDVDPEFIDDFVLYWAAMAGAEVGVLKATHGRGFRAGELDPMTTGLLGKLKSSPLKLGPAIGRLRKAGDIYARQIGTYDVLLSPVLAAPPPPLGEYSPDQPFEQLMGKLVDYVGFTPINNVAGVPAISLPHTVMPCGLPGAVQVWGSSIGDEATLLDLAYQFEALAPLPTLDPCAQTAQAR